MLLFYDDNPATTLSSASTYWRVRLNTCRRRYSEHGEVTRQGLNQFLQPRTRCPYTKVWISLNTNCMNKVVKIVSMFRGCCKMRIYTCTIRCLCSYICINSIYTPSHTFHGVIWHRLAAARNIKKSRCFRVAAVPGTWHKLLPNPTPLDCQPRAFFTWCFALTKLCYQVKGILGACVPEM